MLGVAHGTTPTDKIFPGPGLLNGGLKMKILKDYETIAPRDVMEKLEQGIKVVYCIPSDCECGHLNYRTFSAVIEMLAQRTDVIYMVRTEEL